MLGFEVQLLNCLRGICQKLSFILLSWKKKKCRREVGWKEQRMKETEKRSWTKSSKHCHDALVYSTVGCRRTVCRRTARLEFHLKRRTTPGWKNELRTVSPHANSVSCEDDFFGGIADFETTPLRRRASSHTVCALQANLRDSKTDWKLRTRLAGVVKNKNDPCWDRLPPVLRHPTVWMVHTSINRNNEQAKLAYSYVEWMCTCLTRTLCVHANIFRKTCIGFTCLNVWTREAQPIK